MVLLPASSSEHDDLTKVRPRIIVAEDDKEMLRLLTYALVFDGYEVVPSGSGSNLYDELRSAKQRRERFSLIISDIRMPGRTGLEVAHIVREWGWEVPLILITAFGDEDTACQAAAAGATCLFSKPFDLDDIRTAVSILLARPTC